jgi:uncharacterized membrane protein
MARKHGGSNMFDFSENTVNIILMVIFIILLIVFLYFVYIWFNKQDTVKKVDDVKANKKTDGMVKFSDGVSKPSGYESEEEKKNVKKTVESFFGGKY